MTFEIHRHGREHYDQYLLTDPPIAAWEASFDGGATWHPGSAVAGDPGWFRWLIAGSSAELGDAVAALTVGDHQPLVRAIANPEIVVRTAEAIRVR